MNAWAHRDDIQLLRGVAVLLVVLYHLQMPGLGNGFLGVDVFFVISGYLMALLHDRGTALDFYRRRLDRLLPASAITISTVVLISAVLAVPTDQHQVADQALAASAFAGNIHYWTQNSYFERLAFNPLLNLWSLGVEVQFYLIVPWLLPWLRRYPAMTWVVVATSLLLCLGVQQRSPTTAFFMMPLRIWAFLLGAWVAWNPTVTTGDRSSKIMIAGLVGLALLASPLKPDSTNSVAGHPALAAMVTTVLTGWVLHHRQLLPLVDTKLGNTLVWLGDRSYPLYLVHFPVIVLVNYTPFGGTILHTTGWQKTFVCIALIAAATAFLHELVEVRMAPRWRNTRARLILFTLPVVAIVAANTINTSRFSPLELTRYAAWEDKGTHRCGKLFRLLHPNSMSCIIGNHNLSQEILLVGNSHADAIKSSLAQVANSAGYGVRFMVDNSVLTGGPDANTVLAEALKHHTKAIFVHYNNQYDKTDVRAELDRFIRLARSAGLPVTLLAPIPYYDVLVPHTLLANPKDPALLTMTRARHEARTQSFRKFAASLSGTGIVVADPAEQLCQEDQTPCRVVDTAGHPFYFDDSHLTLTGARTLEPMLTEHLPTLESRP